MHLDSKNIKQDENTKQENIFCSENWCIWWKIAGLSKIVFRSLIERYYHQIMDLIFL